MRGDARGQRNGGKDGRQPLNLAHIPLAPEHPEESATARDGIG